MTPRPLAANSPVSLTVYSAVWPATERLMAQCYREETEAMLARHREAHRKHQDGMHESFFDAWAALAAPTLDWNPADFPEHYPTAGSSEAIREILRMAPWTQQSLVIFEGEYEGYEAIAGMQHTPIHVVRRADWAATLAEWNDRGPPWHGQAQWWISQPSAIDGNVWPDFDAWLNALTELERRHPGSLQVWVDVSYLGVTTRPWRAALTSPVIAGVVFSLSKAMGAYYRRIGGCWSRQPLPGLWGNRWFKNLDSLYLGERWLREQLRERNPTPHQLLQWQQQAMKRLDLSDHWQASDVPLLVHAREPHRAPPTRGMEPAWWHLGARGPSDAPASRRLCLTPTLTTLFPKSEDGDLRQGL